jgi:hypothetical protein
MSTLTHVFISHDYMRSNVRMHMERSVLGYY